MRFTYPPTYKLAYKVVHPEGKRFRVCFKVTFTDPDVYTGLKPWQPTSEGGRLG